MERTLSSSVESWFCTTERTRRSRCYLEDHFIVNKADVELWVRRAQAALRHLIFTSPWTTSELSSSRFSKNIIQILVQLTSLCLVRIFTPIQNTDDHLIKIVRDLLKYYIAEENTLKNARCLYF